MLYTVKYRKPRWFLWRKLKRVKGDGIIETYNSRFFILEDETRIEIPMTFMFQFSKERFMGIKNQMESETGQNLKVIKNQ